MGDSRSINASFALARAASVPRKFHPNQAFAHQGTNRLDDQHVLDAEFTAEPEQFTHLAAPNDSGENLPFQRIQMVLYRERLSEPRGLGLRSDGLTQNAGIEERGRAGG